MKIFVKVLVKRLVPGLVGEVKACAIADRSIQDNLLFLRNTTERVNRIPGKSEIMVHLDQSKAFNRFDHQYLAVVLTAAGFGPTFREWITALYSNIG